MKDKIRELGISQQLLSDYLGISRQTLNGYLNGKKEDIPSHIQIQLSDLFMVESLEEFTNKHHSNDEKRLIINKIKSKTKPHDEIVNFNKFNTNQKRLIKKFNELMVEKLDSHTEKYFETILLVSDEMLKESLFKYIVSYFGKINNIIDVNYYEETKEVFAKNIEASLYNSLSLFLNNSNNSNNINEDYYVKYIKDFNSYHEKFIKRVEELTELRNKRKEEFNLLLDQALKELGHTSGEPLESKTAKNILNKVLEIRDRKTV
ncbi:helix-turn-helix domain-containing protein [Haloplasma contractile]|uniref:Helix-turn-helix domain containing protein n=1 Tax=Haloplasma contractile SSD-17B TaxID=1033810 RepID=F7PTX1_9MOLU|nr:helix-turn-helix transcriptional regulator [Haloplasma contractile]ERJ12289.1 Helix-turn-helix domain containing protein [Haloplasma contractile SSD-17B]